MRKTRRYWINIGLFLTLIITCASGFLYGFVIFTTIRLTRIITYPIRLAHMPSTPIIANATLAPVAFMTEDRITLRGWYTSSTNRAAVIFNNGIGANEPQGIIETQLLVDHGYGVLLFFWRGTGSSDGDRVTLGDKEQLDLRAAITFLRGQPDVDPEHIGALGFSLGASILTIVAADDPALKAVVIEAAFPTLEEEIHYQARLLGFLSQNIAELTVRYEGINLENVRPIDRLCDISPRPVFLIYGAEDTVIPPGTAERMRDAACDPTDVWIIQGTGHGEYNVVEPAAYPARLLAFFDTALLEP